MSYTNMVILLFAASMVGMTAQARELNPGKEIVRFTPCPQSPNCVSSLDQDPDHQVEPLRHDLTGSLALARLRGIIEAMPRTKIVQFTARYLRAEFKSAVFRFTDDLELLIAEDAGVIHIRSSSRVGYWDLGVNRRRVERIRRKFDHNQ